MNRRRAVGGVGRLTSTRQGAAWRWWVIAILAATLGSQLAVSSPAEAASRPSAGTPQHTLVDRLPPGEGKNHQAFERSLAEAGHVSYPRPPLTTPASHFPVTAALTLQ